MSAMIWRVEKPTHLLTLTGHLQGLSDACWSPDGSYLCTASDDQTLRVFDCTTGQVLRTFRGHQSYVYCCAYSPRGNVVVSGSYDETIKMWDVRTARCLRSFGSHSDPVSALDFSYDGTMLASGSYDGLCRVWDATTGTCIRTLLLDSNPFVFVILLLLLLFHHEASFVLCRWTGPLWSSRPTVSIFLPDTWTVHWDYGTMNGLAALKSTRVTSPNSMVSLQLFHVLVDRTIALFQALKMVNYVCGTLTARKWYKVSRHTVLRCWALTVVQKCMSLQQAQWHLITQSNCGLKKIQQKDDFL